MLIIIMAIIIVILFLVIYIIKEDTFVNTPQFDQDPYMSCFLIKNEKECNENNAIYNFDGALSKCKWMNDYCGPVRIS
jgi:hypothetical protein